MRIACSEKCEKQVVAILCFLLVCWPAFGQAMETNVLFAQDFEGITGESPPAPIADNSGWAGSRVPLRVVASGDPRYGNVLEGEVNGFAQLVLGTIPGIQSGHIYRIGLDASTTGTQRPEIFLRMGPSPYRVFMTSTETTSESMSTLTYIGKSVRSDERRVLLMLRLNGVTTLRVDNIRVEEIVGELPPGAPPVPGNLVLNASFENAWDGWFVRGDIDFPKVESAPDGACVARLGPRGILSSSWLRLSHRGDYLIRTRARAVDGAAELSFGLSNYVHPRGGSTGKNERIRLDPAKGWQTIAFRWQPPPSPGKITEWAEYFVNVRNTGALDAAILVDAVEVRAIPPDTGPGPFQSAARVELALFTDMPQNVATVGESVQVTVQASSQIRRVVLDIADERDGHFREESVVLADGWTGVITLTDLPCGYWRLTAAPVDDGEKALPGETLLAVVPEMPDLPMAQWTYGTHIPFDPPIRQACWKVGLRLDRLHDTGKETKWFTVQSDADRWSFADDRIQERRTFGHVLLGSLAGIPAWAPRAATNPRTGKPFPKEDTGNNAGMTAQTLSLWEEYARRCAAHWRGHIDLWEVTNEPNLSGMAPEDYVLLFNAAARGIRAGNPDATVVSLGGAAPPGTTWVRDAIAGGAAAQADALSFHGYGNTTWSCIPGPESLAGSVRETKALAAASGCPDIPVWDTECGVEVQTWFRKFYVPHGGAPLDAARMLPKSVAAVRAAGLAKVFYYSASSTTHAGDAGLRCFSDFNGVMKITVVPLAVAISQLEGMDFVERRGGTAAESLVDLSFRGRGRRVRMLWSLRGESRITIPNPDLQLLSMWGRPIQGIAGTEAGYITLDLTGEPVYAVYADH